MGAKLKDFPGWARRSREGEDQSNWECGPCGQTRDSDPLAQSNFIAATNRLDALDPEDKDHVIIRFGHFAVGWVDEIFTRPGSECHRLAQVMRADLDNYPSLDDNILAELEAEAELEAGGVQSETPPQIHPVAVTKVSPVSKTEVKKKLASKHLDHSKIPTEEFCDRHPCACITELGEYGGTLVHCPWTDLGGEN